MFAVADNHKPGYYNQGRMPHCSRAIYRAGKRFIARESDLSRANKRQGWERLCGVGDAVFFVLASKLRGTEETSQQAIQKQADPSRI